MTNDPAFWDDWHAKFRQREDERAIVSATIDPILTELASTEERLTGLGVVGARERYRIDRARLELLKLLRSIEEAGSTVSGKNLRAAESATNREPL